MTRTFSIRESYAYAWAHVWKNLGIFSVVFLVFVVLLVAEIFVEQQVPATQALLKFALRMVLGVWNNVVLAGLYKLTLDIHDQREPDMFVIFTSWREAVVIVVSGILLSLAAFVPLVAGIVVVAVAVASKNPVFMALGALAGVCLCGGLVFVWTRCLFSALVIVDKGAGPLAALRESWDMTRGQVWRLLLLTLVLGLVSLAGFLCLIVGLIVSMPLSILMFVYVYRQFMPQADARLAESRLAAPPESEGR